MTDIRVSIRERVSVRVLSRAELPDLAAAVERQPEPWRMGYDEPGPLGLGPEPKTYADEVAAG
jgi:hypothetical protein